MSDFKNYLESFLEMLVSERGAQNNTISAYNRDLLDFYDFLRSITHIKTPNILRLDKSVFLQFLTHLQNQDLKRSTLSRKLSALRQFYGFLVQDNIIDANPIAALKQPKTRRPLPKILPRDVVQNLIDMTKLETTPESMRLNAMIEMLYASGLRASELVTLPLSALIMETTTKTLKKVLCIRGKGERERLVPLNDHAYRALLAYLNVRDVFVPPSKTTNHFVFPSHSHDGHITRQYLGKQIKRLADLAGIEPESVSPHVFRHAFATHLLENGADLLMIKKLLGHADIETTQIYTHVLPQHVRDLVEKHHPLSNLK